MLKASIQVFIVAASLVAPLVGFTAETSPAEPTTKPVDSLPANPEKGPFLFCYFFGNGDGLHLAYSEDGLKMTPLNNDKIYFKPTLGNGLMRDPCIRQGPDGMYHLVWTTGWWDKGFGVASSPDLLNWGPQQYVDVNKDNSTAVNTWAPELFYNDQKQEWIVFWATTIPGKFAETEPAGGKGDSGPNKSQSLNHRMYYVTTKDFATWSQPKLLVDPGFNCIDATITKIPAGAGDLAGKYLMVIKDETAVPVAKKNLRVMTANSPEGPWAAATQPITKDWVEGPSILRVGDTWYIYYDEYRKGTYGAVRTNDFKSFEIVKDYFDFPKGARHGTVLPVSPATLDRLKKAPPIEIPLTRRTNESRGPSLPPLAK